MKTKEDCTVRSIEPFVYSPEDILGKGYSSVVYKGRNQETGDKVAIKAIEKDNKHTRIHHRMIKSEIEILKQLKNEPHIVLLEEVRETESHTYIITEYCNQGTLKRYMEKKKGLTEEEAIAIFKQILIGYQCIYNAGIIHRDIKPANILMKNGEVKIADFGFAIPINEIINEESLVIGSPMYMPYEALKKKIYSFKGDIWALGITFYQMLSGQALFKVKTEKELIRQINLCSVKKMIPKRFNQKVQKVLCRMLEFDMNERATFQQVKEILFGQQSLPISLFVKRTSKTSQRSKPKQNYTATEGSQKSVDAKEARDTTVQPRKTLQKQNSKEKRHFAPRTFTLKMDKDQMVSSVDTITKKSSEKQQVYKQVSFQLISQIHFCRFAFKLLMRMMKVSCGTITGTLKCSMKGLIFKKLEEVEQLCFVEEAIIEEYKRSKYSKQIENILLQYKTRYTREIEDFSSDWSDYSEFQKNIQEEIIRIWDQVKDLENPAPKSQLVIILDYMITLKQLTKLMERENLGEFHKSSKIEKIVEGVPSKNITMEHLTAIKTKLKGIKLI